MAVKKSKRRLPKVKRQKVSVIPNTPKQHSKLLNRYSDKSLQEWAKLKSNITEYWLRLHFELEAQRVQYYEELQQAIRDTKLLQYEFTGWVRIVNFQYSLNPISAQGSLVRSGRFNYGKDIDPNQFTPFNALYIANDETTAYEEKFSLGDPLDNGKLSEDELLLNTSPQSYSTVFVKGKLARLFDMTDSANLNAFLAIIKRFKVSKEVIELGKTIGRPTKVIVDTVDILQQTILAANWRYYPMQLNIPANGQVFGKLVLDAGLEGIMYPSTKDACGICIALFPKNIGPTSYIAIEGKIPKQVKNRRLDQRSWQEFI